MLATWVKTLYNANYAALFAMEHEKLHVLVNFTNEFWKVTASSQGNMPLKHAVFQTLQTRKNDLSKTFRLTSLQKPKLQPVQSSVSLSICAFFCISCAIYFFSVLSGYFYVSLNLMACSQCLNMTHLLWSLALKMGFEAPSFGHLYCFYSD